MLTVHVVISSAVVLPGHRLGSASSVGQMIDIEAGGVVIQSFRFQVVNVVCWVVEVVKHLEEGSGHENCFVAELKLSVQDLLSSQVVGKSLGPRLVFIKFLSIVSFEWRYGDRAPSSMQWSRSTE